jgi:hypothetical protein
MTPSEKQTEFLRTEINSQTARMPWKELLRFFASGTVIFVSEELDLVDVGVQISLDNKAAVAQWMEEQRIARVSDEQAQSWLDADASLWTVVVKPWLLVQPAKYK